MHTCPHIKWDMTIVDGSSRSHLNRDIWIIMLLSRKSCTLTINYIFWSSGNCLIQQLVSELTTSIFSGTIVHRTIVANCKIVTWCKLSGLNHNEKEIVANNINYLWRPSKPSYKEIIKINEDNLNIYLKKTLKMRRRELLT